MLAAFVAGAVLGIVANSVPTAAPKTVTVKLIRKCAEHEIACGRASCAA